MRTSLSSPGWRILAIHPLSWIIYLVAAGGGRTPLVQQSLVVIDDASLLLADAHHLESYKHEPRVSRHPPLTCDIVS